MNRPIIAIVIPCYNEEQALPVTIPELLSILDEMEKSEMISSDSYIVCVNDGSSDGTWGLVKQLSASDRRIKGITLAHNRGHQYALLAGLMEVRSKCDAAISIDADLQDDPKAMIEMVKAFNSGTEIVYGVRRSRDSDTWFKRNSARAFYRLQMNMGLHTVYDHADYRLMSSRALDLLSEYKEQNLFLRGIVPLIGLRTAKVYYDRHERVAGESKYPLKKMLSFSIDGITSFSARPMRWIFNIGLMLLLCDIIVGIYVLYSWLRDDVLLGWTSLMLSVWFFGSIILMALGVIGEYIGKIFNEVKHRPRYAIDEHVGFD